MYLADIQQLPACRLVGGASTTCLPAPKQQISSGTFSNAVGLNGSCVAVIPKNHNFHLGDRSDQ